VIATFGRGFYVLDDISALAADEGGIRGAVGGDVCGEGCVCISSGIRWRAEEGFRGTRFYTAEILRMVLCSRLILRRS